MKKIISTILCVSTLAFAGHDQGGGGETEALKFAMIASRALSIVQENQSKFPEVSASLFQNAIKQTKIQITNEELQLNGEKKDAINYPEQSLIKVNRFAFRALTSNSVAQIALVVHEYLGILSIDDSNYFISSRVGGILGKQNEPLFKWSCAAVAICGYYERVYSIKGEGDTSGEAWNETVLMGSQLCEAHEGVSSVVTSYDYRRADKLPLAGITNSCLRN